MNILDSSAWLELLVDGGYAATFLAVIEEGKLVVPAISIFEVVKRAQLLGGEKQAARVESHMRRFPVVDLTAARAGGAAQLSLKHKLPMADSIIYAAALEHRAVVWTMDADFAELPQVRYFSK